MAVEELELELDQGALAEADRRIDELFDTERNKRIPKFIPGDPALLYSALADITKRELPLGRVYCEWGSGFGIGTCLAAMLGYEAFGIEIEPSLVQISRQLATDTDNEIEIIESSYIPEGFESYDGVGGEGLVLPENFLGGATDEEPPHYEGIPYPTDEIDVFFVYPWPGEQEFMQELFGALAGDGAILLAYHGDGEMCAYRNIVEGSPL